VVLANSLRKPDFDVPFRKSTVIVDDSDQMHTRSRWAPRERAVIVYGMRADKRCAIEPKQAPDVSGRARIQ
jgi:hypothetical protein